MICMRASDLPAAAPHPASQHPISLSSMRPATCGSVERREVPRCPPKGPTIDGKDGVAGSIPAGGSMPELTSANAGQLRIRGRFCGWCSGQLGVRNLWIAIRQLRERLTAQPFGFTSRGRHCTSEDLLSVVALPDRVGVDRGNELMTLLKITPAPSIPLARLAMAPVAAGTVAGGGVVQIPSSGALQLSN
jgi:hypothetical protein